MKIWIITAYLVQIFTTQKVPLEVSGKFNNEPNQVTVTPGAAYLASQDALEVM